MDNRKKIIWKRIKIFLLVAGLLLLVGTPVFLYFRLSTEGRLALRQAKNVKLQLEMIDIEYYALGKSVYDVSGNHGLSDGVLERVRSFMENSCEVSITSYSRSTRTVLGFIYTNDKYQVIYSYDEEKGDCWQVNYILKLKEYDGQ
ncbi:MAG: hypothetical protein ACI39Q_02455 [Wujia sp.]